MNILLVASDNSLVSGAFNSMVFLAKELKKKGHRVLVSLPHEGNGIELLQNYDIEYKIIKSYNWIGSTNKDIKTNIKNLIKKIKMLYNIIPYFKYKKLIKKNKIDIVHNNTLYTYIAAKSALSCHAKLVWHIREFLEEDQDMRFLIKKFSYNLMNRSDKIICISKKIYEKFSKYLNKNKLKIIYNGIDIDKYYMKDRQIFNKEQINLLCVGGIREKKGQFELAEAVARCKNKYNDEIILNLVGSYGNEEKNRIDEIRKKYNIKCIKLLGAQSNTPKYYSESDIVFMCSTSEAFGRVTVEGMLSGALLIGKNCAATGEIIKNNETGILYKNVDDLIECIHNVIENKEKSKIIAKKGQDFAKENFSAKKNADEIYKVYENVVN